MHKLRFETSDWLKDIPPVFGEFTVVLLGSLLQKDQADIWDNGGSSFSRHKEIIWVVGKSDKEHREMRVWPAFLANRWDIYSYVT